MKKDIKWLIPQLICIAASVASVFLPILSYGAGKGATYSFNIISFLKQDPALLRILETYTGPMQMNVDPMWLIIFSILAVVAIFLAFAGVITMSLQRPNTWQFIMVMVGIVGTAVPALLIIAAVILSQSYFPGTFTMGVYPIITPIAMVMCMIAVTRKHKRTKAEREAMEQTRNLIWRAGDL